MPEEKVVPNPANHASAQQREDHIPDLELPDCFTLENTASLAKRIGINRARKRRELTRALNGAYDTYRIYLHTRSFDLDDKAKKQLAKIRATAFALFVQIHEMDDLTRVLLVKSLAATKDHDEPNTTKMLSLVRAYAYRLIEAAGVFKNPRFKPPKAGNVNDLRVLCMALAQIYERYSKKEFAYDYQKGDFLTEGALWVAEAARIVDPGFSSQNLATAVREIPRRIKRLQDKHC